MPGYVIAELEITDPAGFEEYRKQVPATIQKYEYRGPKALRIKTTRSRVVLAEGVSG